MEVIEEDEVPEEFQTETGVSKSLTSRKLNKTIIEQLLNVCASLGGTETVNEEKNEYGSITIISVRKYVPGFEVLDCLRDLRKYLKFDHKTTEREISIQLGQWEILQQNLIPLFLSPDVDDKTKFAVLELLAPLTWAIDPKTSNRRYQWMILQNYKLAFINSDILQALRNYFFKSLSVPYNERTNRDNAKLRLILSIFRNLLGIKDSRASLCASHEQYLRAHLQEQLILKMKAEAILETMITFAASLDDKTFSEWNLQILDIVYLLFNGRDPEELVNGRERIANTVLEDSMKDDQERKRRAASVSSRHSRFGGTVSIQLAPGKNQNVHSASTALKSVDQALNVGKVNKDWQTGKKKATIEKDIDAKIRILDSQSRDALAECAEKFLSEAFNVLMLSVKKDFDSERTKVKEEDHSRFLRVMTFFLKYFMVCREAKLGEFDFDSILGIADEHGIKYVCKKLHFYRSELKFTEVQIALDCLKELLLVVDAMAGTDNDDYKHISFQAQYNLFYEGANVQALSLLGKDTSIQIPSYLEPLIEMTHIYFKMLENFSKTKGDFIMKKPKRGGGARQKRGAEEAFYEENDIEIKKPIYAEKRVDILEIEKDFAHENVVQNYCVMLSDYQKCDERFLYYIAVMFHRIFVKVKQEAYFYKLSFLELFQRIMNDRATIKNTRGYREIYSFIKYAVAKLFKRLAENPLLYIQIFYPKFKKDSMRMILGEFPETAPKMAPNLPPNFGEGEEIEVKQHIPYDQKLRLGVVALVETGHKAFLEWFVSAWASVSDSRQEDEFDAEAARERGERVPMVPDFALRDLEGQTDEINQLLERNNLVRMLFNLLGMIRLEVDGHVQWLIPRKLQVSDVVKKRALLEEFLDDPTLPLKKNLAMLIVKKKEKRERKRKARTATVNFQSSSSEDSNSDGDHDHGGQEKLAKSLDEKRPKKKRKVNKLDIDDDDDDNEAKRELSEKFILDSDDDEEYDQEFFRREANLRARLLAKRQEEADLLKTAEQKEVEERRSQLAERKKILQARAKQYKDMNERTTLATQNTIPSTRSTKRKPTVFSRRGSVTKRNKKNLLVSDDESSSSIINDDDKDDGQFKQTAKQTIIISSETQEQNWFSDEEEPSFDSELKHMSGVEKQDIEDVNGDGEIVAEAK